MHVVDVGHGTGFGSIPHDGITVNGIYEDVYVATTFDKRAPCAIQQLLGVASGMKSPIWPGGAAQSRILVLGLR